jgi:chemotaxis protein MotB
MKDMEKSFTKGFSSFEQIEGASVAPGAGDWSVPWSDLMMVMFVLFVVLFIYSSTHQDVKVLFSRQSAEEAKSASSLDPLIGLIGQISSRADGQGGRDVVTMAENRVLYRSRVDGVSVVREGPGRIRVSLRGDLFFGRNEPDEAEGTKSFALSTGRAADVADHLMTEFKIDPRRVIITGRGAYIPELPGTTQANQALNRRVEIVITNEI